MATKLVDTSKVSKLFIFLTQLQDLKRSTLSVLLSFPTSLIALLLFLLLAYNSFHVFFISLPSLPANNHLAGKKQWAPTHSKTSSSSSSSSSSVMYVVKEENAPMFLNSSTAHLASLQNQLTPISKAKFFKSRRLRKHKRKLKSMEMKLTLSQSQFSPKMRDFFFFNTGNNSSCKVRFFMTWISSKLLGSRELLAVESVFRSHPDACLVIVSNSMDTKEGSQLLKPFSDSGFRVMAIAPDFNYLFHNTPAEDWYFKLRRGNVRPGGVSIGQNLSNLLRLALLYKFGGIYLDTDVIILRSLSKMKNVIGAQTIDLQTRNWSRLNNAVLVFDKRHPLLYKFIEEFALTFDGNKWGHNGPYLVSRVVSRVVSENPSHDFNFTVVTPSAFYPVSWDRIRSIFRGPKGAVHSKWLLTKLKHIKSHSFALHLWNSQSRRMKVQKGSIIDHIMSDFTICFNSTATNLSL